MPEEQLAEFGFDVSRLSEPIGGLGSGQIVVAFCPHPGSDRGFVYARRPVDGHCSILCAETSRKEVHDVRAELAGSGTGPSGYLELGRRLSSRVGVAPQRAHEDWLRCLEAEFAVGHALRATPTNSPRRTALELGCSLAAEARATAEQTYVEALRGAGETPVILGLRVKQDLCWRGRMPLSSLTSVRTDVGAVRRLAARYELTVVACVQPPPLRTPAVELRFGMSL